MDTILSDSEKQELIFLRKMIVELQQENQELKERLSVYEGSEDLQISVYLEKKITMFCSEINNHRIEKKGNCWFFGISGLKFDYGEIWSSPTYWQSLIHSNPVDKNFCLFNFSFQKEKKICATCSNKVDLLNGLYSSFLKNLKKKHNLEYITRDGMLFI